MISDHELWEQANVLWETMPDCGEHSPEERLWWQAGFLAASKLFIARMEHRGKTPIQIRTALGMDV